MNALQFATLAHKNQFRWDGVTPYIEHGISHLRKVAEKQLDQPKVMLR